MTATEFIKRFTGATLSERSASQQHYIALCRLLDQPTPIEIDKTGDEYTFEKGVSVKEGASKGSKGASGFADVWWRGKFGWEYKRQDKHKDLDAAYVQLLKYREDLENPPLLVVCDITRTIIHTNFTGTKKETHEVLLENLGEPESLDLLRRVFTDPNSFKPTVTAEQITKEIAEKFGKLAEALRDRGHDPHVAAHFLMKCMFCLFAEDVDLLPKKVFQRVLEARKTDPTRLTRDLESLFEAMKGGGDFLLEDIRHFNGGLFDDAPPIELEEKEIEILLAAARQDWSAVEPAIFGTLFERSLDPRARAQIGAHYTSREDILLVVEPVIIQPLREEWEQIKKDIDKDIERRRKAKTKATKKKADASIQKRLDDFQHRLAGVSVLDPACGSGNFLYVAVQQLLALEKEVINFAGREDVVAGSSFPRVRPTQLRGIEINPYAAELAQVVIWIGFLQWMRDHGFGQGIDTPVLAPIRTIECRDAILKWADDAGEPIPTHQAGAKCQGPADWPEADFIVGNPPFLGSKVFRQNGLEDDYIAAMYQHFDLPNTSDLCCYWFELARQRIEKNPDVRAGLLATQGIRGGDNRTVLKRIKETGDIFMAWSDREWILDGAAVHVSIVGFGAQDHFERSLDGLACESINSDLTGSSDLTLARCIIASDPPIWSIGTQKGGKFEFDLSRAREFLGDPNPHGVSNTEVVRPWRNASDLTRRLRGLWIIDFGPSRSEQDAALFAKPFELVRRTVYPVRRENRRDSYRDKWWIHQEPRAELRAVLDTPTVLLTPRVAKHRVWVRSHSEILPDCALVVFARSDDYFFGVLHSSVHELWARRTGTQLREAESGFRYTPTTCFETFPLPLPPGKEPVSDAYLGDAHPGADDAHPRADDAHPGAGVLHGAQPPSAGPFDTPSDGQFDRLRAKATSYRYRRNLPHIQPGGRPVFVTFCTRDRWVMPERVRSAVMEHCLHDHGRKLHMHGCVVMPDHVHMVFTPLLDATGTPFGLAEIMNGIKGASAHRINKLLRRKGSVWQEESFDRILRRDENAEAKVDYICNNPVRKGLVETEDDYPWLWREWTDDLPNTAGEEAERGDAHPGDAHPRAGVLHGAQPPSAGQPQDLPDHRAYNVLKRIAAAAEALNEQRERWLNPPEWIEPLAKKIDEEDDFADVPEEARALIRESAIMAAAAKDKDLKKRTLTNLYNERPTWLKNAHEALDRAVLAAYAHIDPAGDWDEDWAEVWRDSGAGQPLPEGYALAEKRTEIDEKVLAHLLRLNLARAGAP